MPTLDEVKEQLRAVGGGRLDLARPEAGLLAQLLGDGERIERFHVASFDDTNGVLYLTSERALYLSQSLRKKTVTQREIPINDIKSILHMQGVGSGTLQITRQSTGETDVFSKLVGAGQGAAFAEYLRARSQGKTPEEAGVAPAVNAAIEKSKASSQLKPLHLIAFVVIFGFLGWYLFINDDGGSAASTSGGNGGASAPKVDVGDGNAAYVACKNYVEDQLKAPSTADWPFLPPYEPQLSGTTYTIRGYVDAQNSFGAMIRTNWTCKVRYNAPNKNYVLDSINIQ